MKPSPICVDASLIVRLVADPADRQTLVLWQRWTEEGRQLVAPSLVHYEVTNALYQYQRLQELSAEAVDGALAAALALPIALYEDSWLHQQAYKFAAEYGLKATYDSHYLALAYRLGIEFWTGDRKLVQAIQKEFSWVRWSGKTV